MRELIELSEADKILQSKVKPIETEFVDLGDSLNRVLAEDIIADINLPPFDRSPLDGYAFLAHETKNASADNPVKLNIIDKVQAGYISKKKVTLGTAIKVSTGAPIPNGATAIVKFEDTLEKDNSVVIYKSFKANDNIVFKGEDVAVGEKVICQGKTIDSRVVGMFAALGHNKVNVKKKLKVGIFSTGDELIDVESQMVPGKIRNSNIYALAAEVESIGGQPILYGIIKDELNKTAEVLNKAVSECDLVLSTGGVSVGEHDLVKEAITSIGADLLFWKVNLKPGTPAVAGIINGKLILGLSGNPAAALITFDLLAKPLICKLSGSTNFGLKYIKGELWDEFPKSSGQMRILRANTYIKDGTPVVKLSGNQSPGVMKSILNCNSYVVVEAGSGPLKHGDVVNLILNKDLEVMK